MTLTVRPIDRTRLGQSGATRRARRAHLSHRPARTPPAGTHGSWVEEAEALPADRASHGGVTRAWLNSYSRKDGSMGHRVLVGTQDDALRLLQPAKEGARAGWTREEGLATIVDGSQMLPLPLEATNADDERPWFGFALPALIEGITRRVSEFGADAEQAAAAAAAAVKAKGGVRHGDAHGFSQVWAPTARAPPRISPASLRAPPAFSHISLLDPA